MLEALTTTLKVWDASSVMCYWMKTGSMTFPWRVNLSLQPLGQIKPLLVRCCCCWVSTSFQVSHLILYSSTSSFWGASPEARLKPFAGHAASLATFQRVLTSSQLDPIVWNSHGGGGGSDRDRGGESTRGWVKAHHASWRAAHTRLQSASSPSSADTELCGESHTYVHW